MVSAMTVTTLMVAGLCVFVSALVARRLADLPITAPMLAVVAGLVVGPYGLGLVDVELGSEQVVLLAEATLALLLFSDACGIDLRGVRNFAALPTRLLLIGLPLSIVLGTALTSMLLTDLSLTEAALVATMLTPTDAALGQAVITSSAVPLRIRETLDIESGLNDGLVVPVFATLALALEAEEGADLSIGQAVADGLTELVIGAAVGAAVGLLAGRTIARAVDRSWASLPSARLGALATLVIAYGAAVELGGSAFIAAFVGGLAFRVGGGAVATEWSELTEDLGVLGSLLAFAVFGLSMVGPAVAAATGAVVLCALGALTVGRMVPTAAALAGTGLRPVTVVFIGWFGPRGLASVLFGLLLVTESDMDGGGSELFSIVVLVVLASVLLHGATASPLATRYGRWHEHHPDRDEMAESVQTGGPGVRPVRM